MMTKNADKKREQMMMFSMDDMVPQNHMLRLIDKAINWNFIYDLVEEKYCPDNGRPSMDPVMLIKIPFIQYLYGIKKHASDHERDRSKRCIPLVSRTIAILLINAKFQMRGTTLCNRSYLLFLRPLLQPQVVQQHGLSSF